MKRLIIIFSLVLSSLLNFDLFSIQEKIRLDESIKGKISEADINLIKSIADELLYVNFPLVIYQYPHYEKNPDEMIKGNCYHNHDPSSTHLLPSTYLLQICPYFLESLNIEEKKFIIGRELLKISSEKRLLDEHARDLFALIFSSASFIISGSLYEWYHNIRLQNIPDSGAVFGTAILCTILPIIFKKLILKIILNEYYLDFSAAASLNVFDGAISYLRNYQKYYSVNDNNYTKRIEALENARYNN